MTIIPLNTIDTDSQYKNFYDQVGGSIPVFSGARYQKGHGLGNVLSSLAKAALPMIKRGAVSIGKTALKTGVNIARDKLSGKSLKQSVTSNLKRAGMDLAKQAFNHITRSTKRRAPSQPRYKNKKRRVAARTSRLKGKGKTPLRRKPRSKDVFS